MKNETELIRISRQLLVGLAYSGLVRAPKSIHLERRGAAPSTRPPTWKFFLLNKFVSLATSDGLKHDPRKKKRYFMFHTHSNFHANEPSRLTLLFRRRKG